MNPRKKSLKILLYASTSRVFQATLIGYLYEIAKFYPVVLLSEELDFKTKKILGNKKLFPNLEKTIVYNRLSSEEIKNNLFFKNRYFYGLAKGVVGSYKPDIIISSGDMYSLFDLYLMRFGKKNNVINIAIQTGNVTNSSITSKFTDLTNANLRFPKFLPLFLRLFLARCRKYIGHILYYWILPLTVMEKPFFGRSSHILRKGHSGMRDADYQIVFSKKDYQIYIEEGVSEKKLYILPHPLTRDAREIFKKIYSGRTNKNKRGNKIILLMLPTEIELGFREKDFSLICREEREKEWVGITKLISEILCDWKVYVKPHPDTKNLDQIKEKMSSICKNIEIANPEESADKYIEMANTIIGLPLSSSGVLFTASLRCPARPIISLDFEHEILGDYYKDFEGIEYIDSKEELVKMLEEIYGNKYQKKVRENKNEEERYGKFSNAIEMLEILLNKK